MTNILITNLINRAFESTGKPSEVNGVGVQLYYDSGTSTARSHEGDVKCFVLITDRHTAKKRHFKATFKLNGKVISRVDLEKALAHEFYPGGFNGQCTVCDGYEGLSCYGQTRH